MKNGIFILFVFFTAALNPINGHSATNGETLLLICDGSTNTQADMLCLGYIKGTMESIMMAYRVSSRPGVYEIYSACFYLKDEVSYPQLKLIIEKFLRDHPEKLHLSALSIVIFSVEQAFPCTE